MKKHAEPLPSRYDCTAAAPWDLTTQFLTIDHVDAVLHKSEGTVREYRCPNCATTWKVYCTAPRTVSW